MVLAVGAVPFIVASESFFLAETTETVVEIHFAFFFFVADLLLLAVKFYFLKFYPLEEINVDWLLSRQQVWIEHQ